MQERHPDFSLAEAARTRIVQTLIHSRSKRTEAAGRLGILIRRLHDQLRCCSEAGIEMPGPPVADDDTDTARLANLEGAR